MKENQTFSICFVASDGFPSNVVNIFEYGVDPSLFCLSFDNCNHTYNFY